MILDSSLHAPASTLTVILGAGHGETVAETIELLGIDAIDPKTPFQQGLDDRSLRRFGKPSNPTRWSLDG